MNKRILGIDYGTARVGIAVSDPLHIIARGVTVIAHSSRLVDEIKKLAVEYDAALIVVGYPYTLKGTAGAKSREVDGFVDELRHEVSCPVVTFDERFSSKTAMQTLRTMGARKKDRQRKGTIDEMAAAVILQTYLDSHKVAKDELS